MGPQDLVNKLHDEPFKPFRVRLSNNNTIDVLDPGVGPTSAIMPLEYVQDERGLRLVGRWKPVALAHMVEFVDLEEKRNGSKRRK